MKRLISLILVIVLVCSFAACKGKSEDGDKYGSDFNYFLNNGKFDTAEFGLGTPTDDIDKTIKSHEESHTGGDGHEEETVLIEGPDYNYYATPDFYYYYNADNAEKGISFIAAFNEFYGFYVGETGEYEVKSALESHKLTVKESAAEESDFFHMPVSIPDCKKFTVEGESNVLEFYFENEVLIFAVIYNKDNWKF